MASVRLLSASQTFLVSRIEIFRDRSLTEIFLLRRLENPGAKERADYIQNQLAILNSVEMALVKTQNMNDIEEFERRLRTMELELYWEIYYNPFDVIHSSTSAPTTTPLSTTWSGNFQV